MGDGNLSDVRPAVNLAVAAAFRAVAERLERDGANPFRVRAYLRAAATVEQMRHDLAALAAAGRLQEIRGVGRDLAAKITEFIETGAIASAPLSRPGDTEGSPVARAAGNRPTPEFLHIPGVTPAAARFLHYDLGIENADDLARVARSRLLRTVPGFGAELERRILDHLSIAPERQTRDANS